MHPRGHPASRQSRPIGESRGDTLHIISRAYKDSPYWGENLRYIAQIITPTIKGLPLLGRGGTLHRSVALQGTPPTGERRHTAQIISPTRDSPYWGEGHIAQIITPTPAKDSPYKGLPLLGRGGTLHRLLALRGTPRREQRVRPIQKLVVGSCRRVTVTR